jgi:hypothetical protein
LFSSNSVQEINTHSKKLLKIFHELSNLDIISYDDLKMLDELSKEEFDKLCELFTLVKAECDLVDGNNDKLELSKL